MGNNTAVEKAIKTLNSKLDAAIKTRSELENQLTIQSALLTGFISKLSQACKGIDSKLDNKLAKLRLSFKKSINLTDLEKEIIAISSLLQQHADVNDKKIKQVHDQLHAAIINLRTINNLPVNDRQHIKKLAYKIKEKQDSLLLYSPIMSDFLAFYETITLRNEQPIKDNISVDENVDNAPVLTDESAPKNVLNRFNTILSTLSTSGTHKSDISKIKSSLSNDITHQVLMTKCLTVFDFIIDDLSQERSTAKMFLSTLSETLVSVQESVKSTLISNSNSGTKHDVMNKEITEKITEIGDNVNESSSIDDVKEDVNNKLLEIANTFKMKAELEQQQRELLQEKLNTMSVHVDTLEQQSIIFEKRIIEQQRKSLTDALTKLNNRAAFDAFFSKEVVRFHHKPFELFISVVDIDDFKRINDTYGHTAGDKTLQVIANTLTKVAGEEAFISRYGGEEFVLIFSNINKDIVMNKLSTLCKVVAKLPFTFKNTPVSITLSVGVTLMKKDDNIHSAFERADAALYQAKKTGKNRVVYD